MACKYPPKCGAEKCDEQHINPDFAAFEKEFDLVLPDDYSDFLLEWNCLVFIPPDGYKDAVYQKQSVHKHLEHTLPWDECNPEQRFTENSVQVQAISTLFQETCKVRN